MVLEVRMLPRRCILLHRQRMDIISTSARNKVTKLNLARQCRNGSPKMKNLTLTLNRGLRALNALLPWNNT